MAWRVLRGTASGACQQGSIAWRIAWLLLALAIGNLWPDGPPSKAFARKHVFPVGLRELRQRIQQGDLSRQEYSSTLASLQKAYEQEMVKWGRRRKWEKALGFLQEMKDFDYQPGVPAYSAAIRACCEKVKRSWPRGLALLEEIKDLGMVPDEAAFSAALSGCVKDRQWKLSIQVLRDMLSTGARRRKATFMDALHACQCGGLWQDAIDIIEVMEESDIDPASEGFNKAMDACLTANEDDWFDVMEDKAAARGYEIIL
ncbi:unnamed protein product [Durusdinium trenchii]|uniref:Pentatricopeptide repeat-containing protein n=1 Tax=Durusdinium trenchii TaxID=1381693 RepID=A0ABP0S998_9DINO